MSLGDHGGQGGALSLPGQHLVLNLPDLLLEVPGLGGDGLPDGGIPDTALPLPGSAESLLAWAAAVRQELLRSKTYPSGR